MSYRFVLYVRRGCWKTSIYRMMNKMLYLKSLTRSAKDLGIESIFRVHQDNQKHTSGIVQTCFKYNCPQPTTQSPDLNVIENLWAILDSNIENATFRTKIMYEMG